MEWETPIQLMIREYATKIVEEKEKLIYEKVVETGVRVDKEKLVELLKKDRPMEVNETFDYTYICPTCKEYIDVDVEYYAKIRAKEGKENYCPYCGQKLVWCVENGRFDD